MTDIEDRTLGAREAEKAETFANAAESAGDHSTARVFRNLANTVSTRAKKGLIVF